MRNLKLFHSPYRTQSRVIRHEEIKQAKKTVNFVIKQSWIVVGLLVFASVLGLFQVVTYNNLATKGYGLKRLEIVKQKLVTQSEITNQYLADARSMSNLITSPFISNMRSPAKVQYVIGTSAELAKAY